jgi:hypothetical protein
MNKIYLLKCCFISALTLPMTAGAQTTVTINPTTGMYSSGTIGGDNQRNKEDDILQLLDGNGPGTGNYGRGWIRFDLSSLPSGATINAARLSYNVGGSPIAEQLYIKGYATTSGSASDPAVATGTALYDLCDISSPWKTVAALPSGTRTDTLDAAAVSYIGTHYASEPLLVFTIGNSTSDFTKFITISGYSSSNPPSLELEYTPGTSGGTSIHAGITGNTPDRVYPSPFTGTLTVETQEAGTQVQVLNHLGQQVWAGRISGNRQELDLSLLAGGMYFVQVQHKTGHMTVHRVLKK